jgi:hypothetical protein
MIFAAQLTISALWTGKLTKLASWRQLLSRRRER